VQAINYYRNIFTGNARYSARVGLRRGAPKFGRPTLVVWGEDDGALGKASAPSTGAYVEPGLFHLAMVPNASHWVQQDAVEEVVAAMASFLGMTVPGRATPVPLAGNAGEAGAVSGAGAGGGKRGADVGAGGPGAAAVAVNDLRELYHIRGRRAHGAAEAAAGAGAAHSDGGAGSDGPASSSKKKASRGSSPRRRVA
jgi:hypothetical protein